MLVPFVLLLSVAAPTKAFQERVDHGVAAVQRGDLPAAQSDFESATRLEPGNPTGWLLLAQAFSKQNDNASALRAAAKAETLGADDPAILQGLANFYVGFVQDLPKAASLGARYAERAPKDKTAWRRVANLYLSIGRPEDAISTGSRGLPVDDTIELHTILGTAYSQQRQWRNAASEFAAALMRDASREEAHFRLAQVYLNAQDFPAAIKVLNDAAVRFPNSAQISLALGVAHYGMRNFSAAVDQFLRTMTLAPDVPQPYLFLGRIMEHATDRLPEVTRRFAEYHDRNPGQYLGYLLHAKALVAQLPSGGETPESAEAYRLLEKALALKEDDAETHYLLGVLLDRKRDFPNAAARLERSVQLNPNDSAVHYRLAKVYDRLGRKAEAAQQRAIHEKLSEAEKNNVHHAAPVPVPSGSD